MTDEKLICKICNESFDNDTKLHRHFRKHNTNVVDYYQVNFPCKDRLTGEFIEFKNKEHYFSNDFNSKENLIKWFETKATESQAKEYITNFLLNRKAKKNLIFAPCQVELRTLMSPSVITVERFFGDYQSYVRSLGFNYRFFKKSMNFHYRDQNHTILIDTREQKALDLQGVDTKIETLNYGDYKLEKDEFSSSVVIERKSPSDFVCTFSSHLDRFKNELERCKNDKAYMIVLIEEGLSNLLDFKNKSKAFAKTKITPEFLFRNVRDLLQTEDKIQFLFVKNRDESARVAKEILTSQTWHLSDLQYYYDKKEL